jgi:LysM repeat protein
MRRNAFALIALLLILASAGCINDEAPPAEAPLAVSPSPTLPIGVSFATVTPPAGTSTPAGAQEVPTNTPPAETPTPALAIYIVRPGDTLVGIAAAQGITLNELLSLNPDVQPELLTIGQEVFLPPKATLTPSDLSAAVAPPSIEIAGLSAYDSAAGGTWVLGEVFNKGQAPVELVQVSVSLSDMRGELLASEELWVTPVTIPSLTRAPFGTLFSDVSPGNVTAAAEIVSGRQANALGSRYLDLAVDEAEVTIGRSPIRVSGQIENNGEFPAGQISLVTTFYDDQGQVTGFHELVLENIISPGDRQSFEFISLPPGGRADRVGFAFQAIVAE